jgi:hypothetical protein
MGGWLGSSSTGYSRAKSHSWSQPQDSCREAQDCLLNSLAVGVGGSWDELQLFSLWPPVLSSVSLASLRGSLRTP